MLDNVLAIVDGREVKDSDLISLMKNLGQNGAQFQSEEGKTHLLNEIIAQELLYSEALENNTADDEAFQTVLKQMEKSLLIQYAANNLMTSIKVDDAEAKAFFEANPNAFKQDIKATAKHILTADKETADKALAEIQDGLSFGEAALKYSSCPSKDNGGELGEFTKGSMVPEFEEAAFKMTPGEISAPVKTQFGYHVIQLDSISNPEDVTFDEVKDQVVQQLTANKQNATYAAKQEELKGKYPVEMK